MTKVEVRIRYCCCCSLTIAAILIAIYTLILYAVFLGLASWSLSRVINGVPDPAESCGPGYSFRPSEFTVVTIDPYFCTLGWYTEELKFTGVRYPVLVINIILFILILISAALVFVALCLNIPYLLLPWIGFMILDIIRGTISCILIFVYAHYASEIIKPIATGIFFLGLQFFHLSLVLIMIAKFQKMLSKIRGIPYPFEPEPRSDKSVLVENVGVYPAPGVAPGPGYQTTSRRDVYYNQGGYNTYQPSYQPAEPTIPRVQQRAPSDLSPANRDEFGRPYYGMPPPGTGGGGYSYSTHQYRQSSNVGRTM